MKNARNYSMLSDAYEFRMADAYLSNNKKDITAVFDLYFRKVPNNGGYCVMAGLDKVIDYINNLHFSEENIEFFEKSNYSKEFIEKIKNFKFTGTIYAVEDGTPIFPNEPIMTIEAPIFEAQIVETALLSILNGAIEHATAARRVVEALPDGVAVMEFGARRADGPEAAIDASYYGVMAGCAGTSNCQAAELMGIKALGTMAHSFVETFDTELEAFKAFALKYPDNCTLLVDTYDTLRSGVKNAIKTFQFMKDNGIPTDHIGIRIDSGDLAYLSKEARKMMDKAGFPNATICLSNGLKAETIESLIIQGAKFNSLGVGDNISKPEGRLGAVYKEVAVIEDGNIIPKIKLSNDSFKIVNPGFKDVYRAYDKDTGFALADVICRKGEVLPKDELRITSLIYTNKSSILTNYVLKPLQKTIFKDGILVYEEPSFEQKKAYCTGKMALIYPEVKRTLNPHEYYVDGTDDYIKFKENMIAEAKQKAKSVN